MSKSKSKSPSIKTPTPAAPPSGPPPEPPTLAAAFARMFPAAEQLPAERVVPCRYDVHLVFANVQAGLLAVQPFLAQLQVDLPSLPVARFGELDDLAKALIYAADQATVSATPMKRELLDEKLTRLFALREPLLLYAEAAALLKILPAPRVAMIRRGSGPFDAAKDALALIDLFTEYAAALKDKHPFTPAQLTEAAELGQTVLHVVTPAGGRLPISPELAQAVAARDRLYSLLAERHADLRKAGFYLFGEQVDEKVPVLGARRSRARATATEPAPPTPAAEAPLS